MTVRGRHYKATPPIEPTQLLNCLNVLLSVDGGIKSKDELQRVARLMLQFSRKLVSKCIYVQILKYTETELLGSFMGLGGWRLVHMWLTESIVAKNWSLVQELLELLLLCPVDIERLKTNNCPKLVKELSKDESHRAIRALASKLVEQWLKIVKGDQVVPVLITDMPKIISDVQVETKVEVSSKNEPQNDDKNKDSAVLIENHVKDENAEEIADVKKKDSININEKQEPDTEAIPVLKITLKNGKQIISQVNGESESLVKPIVKTEVKDKHKRKHKEKTNSVSNSSNSSSKSSTSKHISKSKSSDKHNSHKDPSRHSSKDRKKDKDKHSSSSSHSSKSKHSSSSSSSNSSNNKKSRPSSKLKDDKSTQKHSSEKEKTSNEKDEKPQVPSIHKLGKIPKLSDVKREKPSISIEVRKPDEPKPKTVKTFNSKFRKHGLEEEIKPPPSRAAILSKKPPPPILPPTVSIPKRPSPVHNDAPPPEKKPKTEIEKPGAIKLIPPKPKQNLRFRTFKRHNTGKLPAGGWRYNTSSSLN